ncbi:hypothetical protein [Spiroplasma endosymbiont of Dromius quadrimaculatus]|uniref:hypothetical protein n=2 Tax=unclassified Spiroplasma TaxID=2637901 RepID=UPI00313EFFFE
MYMVSTATNTKAIDNLDIYDKNYFSVPDLRAQLDAVVLKQDSNFNNKIKAFFNWSNFKYNFSEQLSRKDLNEDSHFLMIYNYFSRIFGKKNTQKWLFAIDELEQYNDAGISYDHFFGMVVNSYKNGWQFLSLSPNINNQKYINQKHQEGYLGFNTPTVGLIHLYGQVLAESLKFEPANINRGYLPDNKNQMHPSGFALGKFSPGWFRYNTLKKINFEERSYQPWHSSFNMKATMDKFIIEKLENNNPWFNNSLSKSHCLAVIKLVKTFLGNIKYSLSYEGNLIGNWMEQWLLTPLYNDELSVQWELLQEFFTDYLPKTYKETIKNWKGVGNVKEIKGHKSNNNSIN